MNDTEREAIILNTAWQIIDGMVNWAIFVKDDRAELSNLTFGTREHARLFIILLRDFLSKIFDPKEKKVPLGLKPAPENSRLSNSTFLFHLRQVCYDPKFGTDTRSLSQVVESFADWLEGEFTAKGVRLSDIGEVPELRITRIDYLQMCGDIAKHNLARLSANVRRLRKLLEAAKHPLSEQEAYLAVDSFYTWFQDDIFIYHSSRIAEFLNNIRWSIYEYLQPEFKRSWYLTDKAKPDFQHYSYRIPPLIADPVAQAMYWNVMNRSRSAPLMQRFAVSEFPKRTY